jgi:hypothetical protein
MIDSSPNSQNWGKTPWVGAANSFLVVGKRWLSLVKTKTQNLWLLDIVFLSFLTKLWIRSALCAFHRELIILVFPRWFWYTSQRKVLTNLQWCFQNHR